MTTELEEKAQALLGVMGPWNGGKRDREDLRSETWGKTVEAALGQAVDYYKKCGGVNPQVSVVEPMSNTVFYRDYRPLKTTVNYPNTDGFRLMLVPAATQKDPFKEIINRTLCGMPEDERKALMASAYLKAPKNITLATQVVLGLLLEGWRLTPPPAHQATAEDTKQAHWLKVYEEKAARRTKKTSRVTG